MDSDENDFDVMMILQSTIASVGVLVNLLAVVVFLNHKTLRCKIPNIFIINQVGHLFLFSNKCNMSNIFQNSNDVYIVEEKTRKTILSTGIHFLREGNAYPEN